MYQTYFFGFYLMCWLCMVRSSSANRNTLSIYRIITDTTNPITNNVFFAPLFANWSWQCAIKLHFCCTKHTSAVFDGCGWFGCTSANPNTLPRNKITNCTLNTIKIIILQSQIYFLMIPRTVNWSWQFNAVGTVNSRHSLLCGFESMATKTFCTSVRPHKLEYYGRGMRDQYLLL